LISPVAPQPVFDLTAAIEQICCLALPMISLLSDIRNEKTTAELAWNCSMPTPTSARDMVLSACRDILASAKPY
jgi:hypothetical protein